MKLKKLENLYCFIHKTKKVMVVENHCFITSWLYLKYIDLSKNRNNCLLKNTVCCQPKYKTVCNNHSGTASVLEFKYR